MFVIGLIAPSDYPSIIKIEKREDKDAAIDLACRWVGHRTSPDNDGFAGIVNECRQQLTENGEYTTNFGSTVFVAEV